MTRERIDSERIYSAGFTAEGDKNEADVCKEFDAFMAHLSKWFHVESEVRGWYVAQRPHVAPSQPQIDRILRPNRELIREGWDLGPIGIEIKRESCKIGLAISQAMDYSHAVFPVTPGLTCHLEWVFVWPVPQKVGGCLASVMNQQRIGRAFQKNGTLQLWSADQFILDADQFGVHFKRPNCGNKVGSR